jgi:hypothetical protein
VRCSDISSYEKSQRARSETIESSPSTLPGKGGRAIPTSITFGSPFYAFPTNVCKAGLCFSQTFDFSTGKLTSRSDFNGVTTSLAYNDALDRLTTPTAVRLGGSRKDL